MLRSGMRTCALVCNRCLQVGLPVSTKFLCEHWSIDNNFDEGAAILTDGAQQLNLKAHFRKLAEDRVMFDYYNKACAIKQDRRLPEVPAGVEEFADQLYNEARAPGSIEAGGFRDPTKKRQEKKCVKRGRKGGDMESGHGADVGKQWGARSAAPSTAAVSVRKRYKMSAPA